MSKVNIIKEIVELSLKLDELKKEYNGKFEFLEEQKRKRRNFYIELKFNYKDFKRNIGIPIEMLEKARFDIMNVYKDWIDDDTIEIYAEVLDEDKNANEPIFDESFEVTREEFLEYFEVIREELYRRPGCE